MIGIKEKRKSGIDVLKLENEEIRVEVLNYGCTITRIEVRDRNGHFTDCVLGFEKPEDYMKKDGTYLGAFVGRVCNRIGKGTFSLNRTEYHVPVNNGPNSLHGGIEGFSYKFFTYQFLKDGIDFHYTAQDGEEGYPGEMEMHVVYTISGSRLSASYTATSTKDTLVNFTNHSYFNLNGTPSPIQNHVLYVKAGRIGCIDSDGLYTGKTLDVQSTPFDFRKPTEIGKNLEIPHEQLTIGKGYDHPFLFDEDRNQVELYSPETGIVLRVSTSLPQAQLYSANYLNGQISNQGTGMYEKYALCIETQYMPDSVNKEKNSPTILRKGETYSSCTTYTFGVKE